MGLEAKDISRAVIGRLPRYYRYLGKLKDEGIERISSQELSLMMHVTASQIRQDLNNFGGFGQQGYGYNVKYLYDEIAKILGLDRKHNLILIGAGHLGQALANYVNFERRGFVIHGIFDKDAALCHTRIRGIEVMPVSKLAAFLKDHEIEIAVLAIPGEEAEKITQQLIAFGIKAIWNFAHVDLDVPSHIVVENVHLSESLMKLSYNLNRMDQENGDERHYGES